MQDSLLVRQNSKISVVVSKETIEDIVNSLPKTIAGIKVNVSKTNVSIMQNGKYVGVFLEIKVAKNEKISTKLKEIKNKIETHCFYLLDRKPKNIIINYISDF